MKYKYLKSMAIMSLAASSISFAQDNESPEAWDVPAAGSNSFWNDDLSQEELKAIEDMKAGGTTYWIFTAASGATPYQTGYTYNYGGAGCMNASGNGGNAFFDQNINIPDGHEITFMRYYYNDTDAGNQSGAFLSIADGAGGYTQLEAREGTDDTGYSSTGESMSHIVDNTNGALLLRYRVVDSATVAPCGVRFVVSSN